MPEDTKEQRKDYVAGLLLEKQGVVQRRDAEEDEDEKEVLADRVKAIDAELKRMGHEAKAPAKRAEARPKHEGEHRA